MDERLSTTMSVQDDHVDLLLTSKAFTRNLSPLIKLSTGSFIVKFWSGYGRAFGANVRKSGRTTAGFSTTTTRPLTHRLLFGRFWLPKTRQWFPTHPIRLTSPPATFLLFPKMKFRLKCRRSRDAWNHGKNARITVSIPKGTTSKETVETRSYDKQFFYVQIPWTLGSTS
jgi:hypothetical protein